MHVFGGCRGSSLRKQPTFGDTTTGFPAKNSTPMTRFTTQIWIVLLIGRAAWEIWFNQSEALPRSGYWTRHQFGISALVSQTSFDGETSGSVAKCRLFSRATGGEVLKWCIIGGSEEKKLISEISIPSARCSHSQQYYNQCLNRDLLYRRVVWYFLRGRLNFD